jgi:glutamyl-tRNA reductase
VLGQIRAALDLSRSAGGLGAVLEPLFRAGLKFGRHVRSVTGIGTGALSTASAAVRTLQRKHPDLADRTAVVLGAGDTGRKAAQHLRDEGIGRMILVNRTYEKACQAAAALGADCMPIERLDAALAASDVLVVAVHVPAPCVTPEMVQRWLAARDGDVMILDLSVPRAVASSVDGLPRVTLVDLSGLDAVVERTRASRECEIPRVEALMGPALEQLEYDLAEAAARPLVAEMRVRAERIRRDEVSNAVAKGLADEAVLDYVTRRVIDRMMSAPSAALRESYRSPAGTRSSSCLQCVFGVDPRRTDGAD